MLVAAAAAAFALAMPSSAQCNAGITYFDFGGWPTAAVISDAVMMLPVRWSCP